MNSSSTVKTGTRNGADTGLEDCLKVKFVNGGVDISGVSDPRHFLRARSHTRRGLCSRSENPSTSVYGEIGNIEEVFHWNGLISTVLISVLVFCSRLDDRASNCKVALSFEVKRVFRSNQSQSTRYGHNGE